MYLRVATLCVFFAIQVLGVLAFAHDAAKPGVKLEISKSLEKKTLLPNLKDLQRENFKPRDERLFKDLNRLVEGKKPLRRNLTSVLSKFELMKLKFNEGKSPKIESFHHEQILKGACYSRTKPNQTVLKSLKVFVSQNSKKSTSVRLLPEGVPFDKEKATSFEKWYPSYFPLSEFFRLKFKDSLFYSHKEIDAKTRQVLSTSIFRLRQLPANGLIHRPLFIVQQICSNPDGCGDGVNEEVDAVIYGEPIGYCTLEADK